MAVKPIYQHGDTRKDFVTVREPGAKTSVFYRKFTQDMDPVIDRVRHLAQKVNTAPKAGNQHDLHYVGSLPMTILIDWLNARGLRMDQWARDEGGIKQQFKDYVFKNRDLLKFTAKAHV